MRTPLHTPTTLEACKKSTPCLIQKALRCAADRTSKTTTLFIFHFLYNTKILRENNVYFFISLFQWWKLYYIFTFFIQRITDFKRVFASLFFLIQDNFMFLIQNFFSFNFRRCTLRSEINFSNWKPFKNDEKCFFFLPQKLFPFRRYSTFCLDERQKRLDLRVG